jgi:hypothetical protein
MGLHLESLAAHKSLQDEGPAVLADVEKHEPAR